MRNILHRLSLNSLLQLGHQQRPIILDHAPQIPHSSTRETRSQQPPQPSMLYIPTKDNIPDAFIIIMNRICIVILPILRSTRLQPIDIRPSLRVRESEIVWADADDLAVFAMEVEDFVR